MYRASLTELDAVVAIARRRSFRSAAVDLGMSGTALSHAVAKLEARLGVRLFNRTTRSVSLTEAGRFFVGQVTPAIEQIRDAMEAARSRQDTPTGTLRINSAPQTARQVLDPLVFEFLRRYPGVALDIVTEGKLIDIVAEGFDLGVRLAAQVPNDMIAVPLGRPHRIAVVGSPAYLKDRRPPRVPADLLGHRCIRVRLPGGAILPWAFAKDGESVQVDVRGQITLDEAELVRRSALAGIGLGYMMEADAAEDIASGRLVRLLHDWTPAAPGLCLYYAGRRHPSAALRSFLALARELAHDTAGRRTPRDGARRRRHAAAG
ncbi:MAG: LysR family transcriptional regulator [Pseudomonadota bacterium]